MNEFVSTCFLCNLARWDRIPPLRLNAGSDAFLPNQSQIFLFTSYYVLAIKFFSFFFPENLRRLKFAFQNWPLTLEFSVLFANRKVSPVTSLCVPCLFFRVISASEGPQLPLLQYLAIKKNFLKARSNNFIDHFDLKKGS